MLPGGSGQLPPLLYDSPAGRARLVYRPARRVSFSELLGGEEASSLAHAIASVYSRMPDQRNPAIPCASWVVSAADRFAAGWMRR
jgi:hypothetical protein